MEISRDCDSFLRKIQKDKKIFAIKIFLIEDLIERYIKLQKMFYFELLTLPDIKRFILPKF